MENLKLSWEELNNPSQEKIDSRNRFFKECEELVFTKTDDGVYIEIDDLKE